MKDIGNAKYFEKEDLRFATPKVVADYRASRLKCNKIVDLCSGIGVQAGAFAKKCKEVLAIEIDKRKVEYAKKNFDNTGKSIKPLFLDDEDRSHSTFSCPKNSCGKTQGFFDIKNLTFEMGDVMDKKIIEMVKEFSPDIIFCDPERLASEKERSLDSIKPNLRELIGVYGKICKNICIEVPPRIDIEKLKELGEFEAEYLSLDNKLNRLNLYFGNLKKFEISVVDIPSGVYIYKDDSVKPIKNTRKIGNYIYEVSEAVVKTGLINEIGKLTGAELLEDCEKNKVLLTSNQPALEFSCLARGYKVIGIVNNIQEINNLLRKNSFGKAIIKYHIEPKDYWKERNRIENGLKGEKECVVLKVNGRFVIGEEI